MGTACNVRSTVSVSGGGEDSAVITTHITVFQVDGVPVRAKAREPVMVTEGDKVLVAGYARSGVLNALAYRNLTTFAEGNEGWGKLLVFGTIFPLVGVVAFGAFSDSFFGGVPLLVGGIFIAVGGYALYRAVRVLQACKLIGQETP
jgi:hypothetical protein